MNTGFGEGLHRALSDAGRGPAPELAARLGFAGFYARLTGRPDPRAEGERLLARMSDSELRDASRELDEALTAAGISHAFIKGSALGDRYQPGDRDQVDIDLAVAFENVESALSILGSAGFNLVPGAREAAPDAMRRGLELERSGGSSPVTLDTVWGFASVNRLLSDCDKGAMRVVLDAAVRNGGLMVPPPDVHLPLLVHHLVHHDLQHARGVVDSAVVWATLEPADVPRIVEVARRFRVLRVTASLTRAFARVWGEAGPILDERGPRLDVAELFALADASDATAHAELTPARVIRRARLLDRTTDIRFIARDLVAPPRAYLAWRWPQSPGYPARWFRHATRLASRIFRP